MKEELTAGGKEFAYVLFWAAALYLLCGIVMNRFGAYAFIGGIIAVIFFSAFGFFVLTHYTARFTYELKSGRLRINRLIGKRNKEIDFACADITDTYYGYKPNSLPKGCRSMRKSIISRKKSMYIVYTDKSGTVCAAVIEPSDKLRKRIEKERTKGQPN